MTQQHLNDPTLCIGDIPCVRTSTHSPRSTKAYPLVTTAPVRRVLTRETGMQFRNASSNSFCGTTTSSIFFQEVNDRFKLVNEPAQAFLGGFDFGRVIITPESMENVPRFFFKNHFNMEIVVGASNRHGLFAAIPKTLNFFLYVLATLLPCRGDYH
ncbi:hypothetical protein BGX38DRAFT_1200940 [Terfezia claveryi]|nr:hypothetical protein BGX38DRAFT_1200940 [Terfezia claveryi]